MRLGSITQNKLRKIKKPHLRSSFFVQYLFYLLIELINENNLLTTKFSGYTTSGY